MKQWMKILYIYTFKKDIKKNSSYIKGIQKESGAKSYTRKGFVIYEEMRKYLTIYSYHIHMRISMPLHPIPSEVPYK
jgi:hypothetical protein